MKLLEKIESTLKSLNNSNYNDLWSECKKIVEAAIQHNKLITAQMSNYDLHDEAHSEQVVNIIENLLSDKIESLTCYEAILLYVSAYLHDSAMALPSWEYELLKSLEGTETIYDNTLTFRICNDFKKEHSYSEALCILNLNKDKLFDFNKAKNFVFAKENEQALIESLVQLMRAYETFRNGYNTELKQNSNSPANYINISKLIRSEFIRQTHHIRVVENIKSLKNKIERAVSGFAADNFIKDLSAICKCHGEPVASIFELPTAREDLLGEKSNIQYLAILLRLGDIIHFSSDRAPLSLFAEKKITDESSFLHWNAKFQDLKFKFDELNGVKTVKYTAYCSKPEVYYFIQDYLNWVDVELDNYFSLKQRWEQFKIEKIESYTLSISNRVDRTQINYDNNIFIPQSNMRFVLNQSKILELLMGVQLYKDEFLCLRELYQNSLDATKCIIAINKQNGVQESLSIEFGIGEEVIEGVNRKYLYCLDHGTGMDKYIINNFLLQIGNSYYKSKDFYRKNTGWNFEVNPTSQFGIGILSGYMLADKIGVTTIYCENNEINSFLLEGVNEHFYYINPSEFDKERIGKHGTIVKLYLKDKFCDVNNCYIEKLPIILGESQSININKYVDEKLLFFNLSYIISHHICAVHDSIPVNIKYSDNIARPIIECHQIMNLKNFPLISKEDLKDFWSEVHFMSGEPNPYLEVIDRLDLIENYPIKVQTENLELYSHISLPKKGMDKNNLYYYYMFHFVGKKEGATLVDGIKVESASRFDNSIREAMENDFYRSAIINFIGKERPVLSVDRKTCVSMPKIDAEIEDIKGKFINQLVSIVYSHVEKEKISCNDEIFSIILNIVSEKFPSLVDKFLILLCETTLGGAPIPKNCNFGVDISIKQLIKNSDFTLSNTDFRKYGEIYRRILIGKLINANNIEVKDSSLSVQNSTYTEFPVDKYRMHDKEYSLSSVAIKADKWLGAFSEYDLVSTLWPIVNPKLFNALHDDHHVKEVSSHCKMLSESSNGVQGIARLNSTLINPDYGIGVEHKTHFKEKTFLLSNPDSIAHNFWLFELTNYKKDTFALKKGASLFAYIAPRELTYEENLRLKDFEQTNPKYVKGVKEGWSILFFSNGEYVIEPGIVFKADIINEIPNGIKAKDPDITYFNTDGTKLF